MFNGSSFDSMHAGENIWPQHVADAGGFVNVTGGEAGLKKSIWDGTQWVSLEAESMVQFRQSLLSNPVPPTGSVPMNGVPIGVAHADRFVILVIQAQAIAPSSGTPDDFFNTVNGVAPSFDTKVAPGGSGPYSTAYVQVFHVPTGETCDVVIAPADYGAEPQTGLSMLTQVFTVTVGPGQTYDNGIDFYQGEVNNQTGGSLTLPGNEVQGAYTLVTFWVGNVSDSTAGFPILSVDPNEYNAVAWSAPATEAQYAHMYRGVPVGSSAAIPFTAEASISGSPDTLNAFLLSLAFS